ncbi:hypothetical protein SBOR_2461 [Sclerotinia borealis F-4128]|uniref:Uncharacterized protein n=1 Tax=Sclerotinia borealis (strain F-4128) TaxID=1432307 RepID=W9CM86_SCLBF|nr:hypothetical protein SBOR_2461 [Sclerotinia borealis F-4128]
MDLLSSIRKSGSRGGVNFSWDEVQSSQHRENYLGHSLMAPVGRWQKGKDLNWYAKGDSDTTGSETVEEKQARERKEEIRKIKEAEEDAIARALGLPVTQRGEGTGSNNVEVGELKRVIKESEEGNDDIEGMGKGTGFGDFVGNTDGQDLLQIKSEEQRGGLLMNDHNSEGLNQAGGSGIENKDTGNIDIDQEVESGKNIGAGVMIALEEEKEVVARRSDTADIEAEALIEDIGQGRTTRFLETTNNVIVGLAEVTHQKDVVEKRDYQRNGVNLLHYTYWGVIGMALQRFITIQSMAMDFTKLRAAALNDGDDEEAVTVNTRALIDKVLARYSGEWTTLRELIQNAADAQATTVTIRFETSPSIQVPTPNTTNQSETLKHILLNHTLKRLLVTNNGQAFGVNDWSRLKRIAEGNPDETKIGAFGVGFYSVFADCEDPFVSSGDQAMAFYWKGNSLFTKKIHLPPDEANPNTSFVLDYRNNTTPMPNLLSVAQFLATSLTFVALQSIELLVDDFKIMTLRKKSAPSYDVPIARDAETKSKEGLMKVQRLERESVQMDATFMNVVGWKPAKPSTSKPSYDNSYGSSSADVPSLRSFFSRLTSNNVQAQQKAKALQEEKAMQEVLLEDLTALTTTNVFLRVTTATIKTYIQPSFAAELERATKKPPPKTTKLAILTASYDETEASAHDNLVSKNVDVFASVLPGKKPGGRIFIGFPTHQTTGAGIHLSAPSVIPTVERESIDLNARYVRTWNIEMLRVAGIMARLAFANEMSDLADKVKRATQSNGNENKVTKREIEQFMPEAEHILKTFTFGDSTPSSQVSQIIEEAFWTAYKKASIEVYSTRNVLPTTKVRLATEDLSGFVEGIPVIPDALVKSEFVQKLKDFELITEITISDVKQELEAKALTKEQLIQFIKWAGHKAVLGEIDSVTVHSLFDVAVATLGDDNTQGGIIALGSVTNYLNVNRIPPEAILPPTTIPFEFTRECQPNELQALGWEPLEIVPWLRYLIETRNRNGPAQNMTTTPQFAAKVLQIISKSWEGMSANAKACVISLLSTLTVIPTKCGMRKPGEAFFESVKLFEDLPTLTNCPGVKEKFLAAIGVRKTVDLETIFVRLLAPSTQAKEGEISKTSRHMDLIKYLASVKDDIPVEDFKRLKESQICPAEAGPPGLESSQGTARMYKVRDLFEPKDALRSLGLPIIQWPGPSFSYRSTSNEGRFLTTLGLRSFPATPELIHLMSSSDFILRDKAMAYFIANHHINGYASFEVSSSDKAILPIEGDEKRRVKPVECFTNEKSSVLGFNILRQDLRIHANKFGVAVDPLISECVDRLIKNPPKTRPDAITLFGYFSSRLGELGYNSCIAFGNSAIVPVPDHRETTKGLFNEKAQYASTIKYLTPQQCYLGSSSEYSEIFDFVDFGTEANTFLLKCGSKSEPTKLELAALVCQEPARLLGIMQSPEKYLNLLRSLANDLPMLKRNKVLFKQMRLSKFLLGSKEISAAKEKPKSTSLIDEQESEAEELENAPLKQWQLEQPNKIVVVDDYNSYRLFKESLVCAPLEDRLEEFYLALGSANLSDIVQEDLRVGQPVTYQGDSAKLRKHILERSKLFLHESPRENVKRDSRWLEKNLTVQTVSDIQVRRSLRGHNLSNTEKRTAACIQEPHQGLQLLVTNTYDTYQISLAMCKHLLARPQQQSYLTFESFLTLSLMQLRSRGYNVERILRAKAAEARIAEEERKRQLEAEQEQIKEQEKQWRQNQKQEAATVSVAAREGTRRDSYGAMPGAFGSDSPPQPPVKREKNRGLFSNLTRRLGLDSSSDDSPRSPTTPTPLLEDSTKNTPPPYTETAGQKPQTESVTSNGAIKQNLLNAIKSSRAHDSSDLFSAPSTSQVKEQAEYCDSTSGQNLTYFADASNGTRIFISNDRKSPNGPNLADFLAANVSSLNLFAALLHEAADIYNLPRKAIHIFYDDHGNTIAFNSKGSIFCNFRFFQQLHLKKLESKGGEEMAEAGAYWWVVLAHELAHNLVGPHNSDHSFYTEQLIANYFPKMMARANKYTASVSSMPIPIPGDGRDKRNSSSG